MILYERFENFDELGIYRLKSVKLIFSVRVLCCWNTVENPRISAFRIVVLFVQNCNEINISIENWGFHDQVAFSDNDFSKWYERGTQMILMKIFENSENVPWLNIAWL